MLRNWIHTFIYQVKHNKLFTLLNILGLSIGIAGIILSILYRNDELAYNAWNPEKDNVYKVAIHSGNRELESADYVPAPMGPAFKNLDAEVDYCYFKSSYYLDIVRYRGRKYTQKIIYAQRNFFSFFPFNFIKGDGKTALQDKNSVAVSDKTARLLFGDKDPIGKQITIGAQKKNRLVVRGVYKIPGKSSIAPQMVSRGNLDDLLAKKADNWNDANFKLLIKTNNPKQKRYITEKMNQFITENFIAKYAKAKGITIKEFEEKYGKETVILEGLKTARLHSVAGRYPEGNGDYRMLMIISGLSVLILLLSIINCVNMATAHAIKRAKEVGIRKAMGATQRNIVYQLLFENSLITFFSILLGLAVVKVSLPYYNDFLKKDLSLYQQQFYPQLVILFLIIIALAGIFPAIYVAGFNVIKVLKGNFARSKKGIWLRNGMLVLQFAIASFFIIGAYIARQQVSYMTTMDLGFKGDQIVEISGFRSRENNIKNSTYNHYLTVKQELLKIKGVKEVSTGGFSFGFGCPSSSSFSYKDTQVREKNMAIDYNVLSMMNIPIIKGRSLSRNIASDTIHSVLVNQTMARMMKESKIIGTKFDWNDHKFTIVGMVKDFHLLGPQDEIPGMLFYHFKTVSWSRFGLNHVFVKIAPENMQETLAAIEKFWTAHVNTDYPFDYDFIDKKFARSYENYVHQKNMFYLLNVVVILIAIFGLYALASYSIERRMKEIAIRKTLGAQTKRLLKNLSKQYLIFCVIGFLIAAFPAYYLLNQWLENFAFRIYISFLPFVISFAVLLFLTLIVVISKAYRATQLNILKYLKYE